MTGPEISTGLHQLVREGVIASWHRTTTWSSTHWIVVPHAGPSTRYTRAGIVDYLEFAQELTHA